MGETGKASEDRPKRGRKSSKNPKPNDPKNPANRSPIHPPLSKRLKLGPYPPPESLELSPIPPLSQTNNSEIARYRSLRLKAETALEALVVDDSCPPNVRAAAARTLLELVGAIGAKAPKHEAEQGLDDAGLEPEGLSLADIDRELRRLSQ